MFIVKNRKIFYSISIFFVVASIVAVSILGLTFGIDFKGGSSVEFVYSSERPSVDVVKAKIDSLNFNPSIVDSYKIVPTGDKGYNLNLRTITETERNSLILAISSSTSNSVEIKKFNSVGPILGKEAAIKSLVSIVLVILFIILYLTFAFRKVSEPVSSWKYGIISIVALLHDITIPTGVFAVLGHYLLGFEVDTLFVTAILVILGFSVHDTIVVFDRVRENLKNNRSEKKPKEFDEVVGMSISQTFIRSINTSLTTLFAVLVVYLVGPEATKAFALTLLIGVFFGTYSSIFIASNLLVTVQKFQDRKKK
jgi:preprotein translocase subunit SecF